MATPFQRKVIQTSLGPRVLDHRKDVLGRNFPKYKPDPEVKLMSMVDLRPNMPPVLNQGDLGSCGSNALANALHYDLWKEFGRAKGFKPSRLYIYYNTRMVENEPLNQDTGITLSGGCQALSEYHACDEAIWPYVISNFTQRPPLSAYKNAQNHTKLNYTSINQDLNDLKNCIASGFPFVFGISVYSSFMSDTVAKTGVVPMPNTSTETLEGGHAIISCGYDDSKNAFICQNSWGTDWGDAGFFYLPYDYVSNTNLAGDFWKLTYFA